MTEALGMAIGKGGRAAAAGRAALFVLRVAIGWHFLYEGLVKLFDPAWTAAGYLQTATGPLAGLFKALAASPPALAAVDALNAWGLAAIGLALMLGLAARAAAGAGLVLLALYWAAHPPWGGPSFGAPVEGHYLFVDKNFVELVALGVLVVFPSGTFLGLDALVRRAWRGGGRPRVAPGAAAPAAAPSGGPLRRRELLGSLGGVPFVGALAAAVYKQWGWKVHEEEALGGRGVQAVTSATIRRFDFSTLKDLKGRVPRAALAGLDLSRVILGGNLIGGWAHARDLIYVSKLVKAYHHEAKIFETFLLAETCGINAFLTNPVLCGVLAAYWKSGLGKIRFISDCAGGDLMAMVRKSIDHGAAACYVQGAVADRLVRQGKFDEIAAALDLVRRNRLPAGIGAHALATVKACVEKGLRPDFWMKTVHRTDYWSARLEPQHDNIWCEDPGETAAFMKDLQEPWIAFKVLAAGAIAPKAGFRFAFESGADFICVGMYDFQIVEDVNLALEVLSGDLARQRPWRA